MIGREQNTVSDTLLEEAAEWHARITSGDATHDDMTAHMEWLLTSPEHANAYEHVSAANRDLGQLETDIRARFAADFKLASQPHTQSETIWTRFFSQQPVKMLAIASMILVMAVTTIVLQPEESVTTALTYTAADQVQVVQLADGSELSLFPGTNLTVRLNTDERHVALAKGRAFFDVASDPARPFVVKAGDHEVTVVGTRFEVLRTDDIAQVAVNEGLVSVVAQSHVKDAILVKPGTIARYTGNTPTPHVTKIAADKIGAWSNGVLVFKKSPLSDILAQIRAMFPDASIMLADASMADMEFSGTLIVQDAEQMLRQLAAFLDIGIKVEPTGIILTP